MIATTLVVALALLLPPLVVAHAQPSGKVYRIGFLGVTRPTPATQHVWDAFLEGLRDRGYVEGRNLVIERRFSEGREDRYAVFVMELLRDNVDVIVTASTAAARAGKEATGTVPIVLAGVFEPEKTGLVASLARPGGNLTGVSNQIGEVQSKGMQLLKEVLPRITRLAVLWNPDNPGSATAWDEQKQQAKALGLALISIEIRTPADVESALARLAQERPDALTPYLVLAPYRGRIIDFALKNRLPTLAWAKAWVEQGALISYGPDPVHIYRRTSAYIDRILRGVKPADLPIEQPTKFEFIINLRTAKALGLTIPPSVLLRADQVIE